MENNAKKIYMQKTSKKWENTWKDLKKLIQQCAGKNKQKSDKLKIVKADVLAHFIKYKNKNNKTIKQRNFLVMKVILVMMITLKKIRSLDLDKMGVTSNKILAMWNGEIWDTKNLFKIMFIFSGMTIRQTKIS